MYNVTFTLSLSKLAKNYGLICEYVVDFRILNLESYATGDMTLKVTQGHRY